jgi:hypothetical protein
MGKAVPAQHPAVVLRSHYRQLRALLAVTLIAIVGLAAAVVIVANESDDVEGTSATQSIDAIHYGGFNPATGRPDSAPLPQQEQPLQNRLGGTRYDGGPEEGTAALIQRSAPATFDPNSIKSGPGVRYDGGPEEGSRGIGR